MKNIKIHQDRNLEFCDFGINAMVNSAVFGITIDLSSLENGVYFYKVKNKTLVYILYK